MLLLSSTRNGESIFSPYIKSLRSLIGRFLEHRSAAMLWVPVRNQHLVRSSFPSSFDYESNLYPGTGKGPWNFVKQFGTSYSRLMLRCSG